MNLTGTTWTIQGQNENLSLKFEGNGKATLNPGSLNEPYQWWQDGNTIWYQPAPPPEGWLIYSKGEITSDNTITATKVVGQPGVTPEITAITLTLQS